MAPLGDPSWPRRCGGLVPSQRASWACTTMRRPARSLVPVPPPRRLVRATKFWPRRVALFPTVPGRFWWRRGRRHHVAAVFAALASGAEGTAAGSFAHGCLWHTARGARWPCPAAASRWRDDVEGGASWTRRDVGADVGDAPDRVDLVGPESLMQRRPRWQPLVPTSDVATSAGQAAAGLPSGRAAARGPVSIDVDFDILSEKCMMPEPVDPPRTPPRRFQCKVFGARGG